MSLIIITLLNVYSPYNYYILYFKNACEEKNKMQEDILSILYSIIGVRGTAVGQITSW